MLIEIRGWQSCKLKYIQGASLTHNYDISLRIRCLSVILQFFRSKWSLHLDE